MARRLLIEQTGRFTSETGSTGHASLRWRQYCRAQVPRRIHNGGPGPCSERRHTAQRLRQQNVEPVNQGTTRSARPAPLGAYSDGVLSAMGLVAIVTVDSSFCSVWTCGLERKGRASCGSRTTGGATDADVTCLSSSARLCGVSTTSAVAGSAVASSMQHSTITHRPHERRTSDLLR